MQLNRLVIILALALHCRYTKYLYPLECRKKNLSNPTELQAAIEGNKREGRRGSYGSFASSDMLPMSHHHLGGIPGMPSQISPMSLVTSHQRQFNGSSHHGLPPGKSCFAIPCSLVKRAIMWTIIEAKSAVKGTRALGLWVMLNATPTLNCGSWVRFLHWPNQEYGN